MANLEIRFRCVKGCTTCCNQQGYVYITEDDLARAAKFTGMTPADFESKYVYRTKTVLRLRKPKTKQCHFLNETGCTIHPAKPTQCRLFPFWPELVKSRARWQATAKYCPGIGTGRLVQIGTALETADEMRRSYPNMYNGARNSPHS